MRCMKCRFVRVHCTCVRCVYTYACIVEYAAFCLFRTNTQIWNSSSWWSRQTVQRNNIKVHTQYTRRKGRRRERMPSHTHATILTETKRTNKKTKNQKSYDIFIVIELCVCALLLLFLNAIGGVAWQWEMCSTNIFDILMCLCLCLFVHFTRNAAVCVHVCVCVCHAFMQCGLFKPIKNEGPSIS